MAIRSQQQTQRRYKMFLVTIQEANGEYEYEHKWLVSEDKEERQTLEDFYGEDSVCEEFNRAFWIHDQLLAFVSHTQEVTEEEAIVLRKFNIG